MEFVMDAQTYYVLNLPPWGKIKALNVFFLLRKSTSCYTGQLFVVTFWPYKVKLVGLSLCNKGDKIR